MLVLTCKEKNSANEITQMGPLTLIYFYFILFWWTSIYILHANEMHLLLHVKRHVVGEPFKTCVLTLHVWVVVFSFGGIFNKPYGSFCCFTLALIFSANSQPTKTWIKCDSYSKDIHFALTTCDDFFDIMFEFGWHLQTWKVYMTLYVRLFELCGHCDFLMSISLSNNETFIHIK
jgi:hypothetical protein